MGNVIAFIVAYFAIKSFISFLNKNGFKVFGYYRIVLGGLILILMAAGVNLEMVKATFSPEGYTFNDKPKHGVL